MKKIRITNTTYVRSGYGEEDIQSEEYLMAEIEYSETGKILTDKRFTSEGAIESTTLNEYDAQDRVIASSQYDESGELCQKNAFEYDADGRIAKKSCFYGEGSPEYATRNVMENGLLIREDAYTEEDFDYTEKTHEYDSEGRETQCVEFNEDNEVLYRTSFEYDNEGRMVKRFYEQPQEHDSRTFTYEYDENGNKTKELLYNFDEKLIAKAYYSYNEDGNVVEMEEENLDIYRLTRYTYEGKNCVKIEQSDRDMLLAWTEYSYNEQGDVVLTRNFIRDEVDPEKFRLASSVRHNYEY